MRGDQLSRQWRLFQTLARSRYGVGLEALASDLECTKRTVYRDLDALSLAGFPLTSEKRDGRVFYRLVETFRVGDVPFTPDELLALAFGEDLLRTLDGTVFHESVRSALAKIRASLSPAMTDYLARLGQSFRVLPGPHKSYARFRDTIRALSDAVLAREAVRIRYRTGGTGEASAREVDPYRVWYRSGGLYVVGLDHRSGEVRTFAVDRIASLSRTRRTFAVRADFDFDAYVGSSFGVVHEPATTVRIRFEKGWAPYVEERTWHPSQTLLRHADGSIELSMEVGGASELRSWVLSFGAGAEVIEPASLRSDVARELSAACARYAAQPAVRRKAR